MARPGAARRVCALAVVAGVHALALFWLATFSNTRTTESGADVKSQLVLLLPPLESRPPLTPAQPHAAPKRGVEEAAEGPGAPLAAAPAESTAPARIDWTQQAKAATARSVARQEEERRRAHTFGTPPPSAMFAALSRKPGFAWNYARTHRVEALPGGVTVFNLSDHCSIALLWVVPFFGCQLGKIPARGDLFDHLHDPPDPGGR
jgi:hypothetical protein